MTRIVMAALAFVCATSFAACSDTSPLPTSPVAPKEPEIPMPRGVVISNSLKTTGSSVGVLGLSQQRQSAAGFVYVSAAPGTFQSPAHGQVRNQSKGGTPVEIEVVDGGFYPVAIAADAGDELRMTFSFTAAGTGAYVAKVPTRKPPAVVRTQPGQGRMEVPLDVSVQVVVSEPLDTLTVTRSSVILYPDEDFDDANAVRAGYTTSSDGLTVTLTPDRPLEPLSTYTLALTSAIRDLDGDVLANSTLTFSTGPGPAEDIGGELLFVSQNDLQLYRIGLDGKNYKKLTNAGVNDHPAWSRTGDLIAFSSGAPAQASNGFVATSDIYIMFRDGSGLRRRTSGQHLRSAVWSPDGKTLAVSDEGVYYGSIWTMSAVDDGKAPVLLAADARSPAWSPDGKRIAFVTLSGDDGYNQVFLIDPDGSNVTPVTGLDSGGIFGLSWSPDGRQLAFGKCIQPAGCDIYIINSDGSQQHRITNEGHALNPTWSPDGKSIAFTSSYSRPALAYVSVYGGPVQKVIEGAINPSWKP